MQIDWRAEQSSDEAAARAATGKSMGEWFLLMDAEGGPTLGRRALGQVLVDRFKLDPWWMSTLLIEYEAAHGLVEKDGRAKGYTICATKSVKASPEQSYAAFAAAVWLDRWLGPSHQLDFRDGGSLRNADGNQAVVKKVSPGKMIKLIWQGDHGAEDTPVEIKFQPAGTKTTIMITHERLQNRAAADGLRRAWGQALDRLKQQLEAA
ncbi:hypothetical protein C7S18_07795 [Ahniella affigens]|uniref:Activator of Hsp90 ATPase homologue 1/2-like C-terminal domain-containing protein n=1 Tax=Ahniella affigens TaxID=2021234 RepID=A0A2P1PQI3_9GAMM|nr:SRPBCC family protein [Ahniella affigens]AVP97100.1 hypothetical protein C7S18_07795 [Ahniella affigens]